MAWHKLLSFLLVYMNLFVSCQKAVVPVEEGILPIETIVLPNLPSASLSLAIIGDSISSYQGSSPSDKEGYKGANYASYYPKGDVKGIENMWWHKVAESMNVSTDHICNCSWSGSRITGNSTATNSAFTGCSTKRITDLSSMGFNPDIVFCYISCNDWASSVPVGDWSVSEGIPTEGSVSNMREAFALLFSKIKTQYPDCLIVCLTNLEDPKRDFTPGWPSNNRNGVSTAEWNRAMAELSTHFGCLTVDLQDCGINYENAAKYSVDGGLHPNDAGMTLIANKVVKELANALNAPATNNE